MFICHIFFYQKGILQFQLIMVQSIACALEYQAQTLVKILTICPLSHLGKQKQIANTVLSLSIKRSITGTQGYKHVQYPVCFLWY
jgi:hypothetical protein